MKEWIPFGATTDFPPNGGAAVLHGEKQIAIFNYGKDDWYAVDNRCPHWGQTILSRGLIGNNGEQRTVACPLHKNKFDLETGDHCGGNDEWQLQTYPVKVENGQLFLQVEVEQSVAVAAD